MIFNLFLKAFLRCRIKYNESGDEFTDLYNKIYFTNPGDGNFNIKNKTLEKDADLYQSDISSSLNNKAYSFRYLAVDTFNATLTEDYTYKDVSATITVEAGASLDFTLINEDDFNIK